jgi:hypothetical protein
MIRRLAIGIISCALVLLVLQGVVAQETVAQESNAEQDSGSQSGTAQSETGQSGSGQSGTAQSAEAAPEELPESADPPEPEDLEQPSAASQPQETDIRLPGMLLEIAEVELDTVAAELPGAGPVELPDVQTPLPAEGELPVADRPLELPSPTGPGMQAEDDDGGEASLFSRGVLGAGSMNHILGSISLYRVGTDPRLRFEFSHEGYDGYQFEEPGTGFFYTENIIEGWVAGSGSTTEFEVETRFRDREEGLQENPDFYSVRHRLLGGSGSFSVRPADRLTIGTNVEASRADRIFTVKASDTARRNGEFFIHPQTRAELQAGDFTGGVELDYDFSALGGEIQQLARGSLFGELGLAGSWFLDGKVGGFWNTEDLWLMPFELGISGSISDVLSISARGGFEVERQRLRDLWQEVSLLETPQRPLAPEQSFFGTTRLTWKISGDSLTADSTVTARYSLNGIDIEPYDQASDVYPLRREERLSVMPNLALNWRVNAFRLRGSWEGHLWEKPRWMPRQSFGGSVEYRHSSQRYGVRMSSELPVYEELIGPRLGVQGFFDIVEGVRLVTELEDVLAPLLPDGRPRIGSTVNEDFPYIQPGFRLIVKTEISL